ncbi:hypothetical protein [Gordonia malaquae]|uniref:hypothetical protein n=1 Tax=Gordonia malaquae TaxID=410332 RepID=UPI003015DE1B
MATLLGLGLGAGLSPDEIAHLTAQNIVTVAPNRYAVALEQRIVPIRTTYAPLLTDLVHQLPPGVPLLRDKPVPRIETLWSLLARCEIPEPLRPLTVTRLRATWAHAALTSPIPITHILGAYGRRTVVFIDSLMHLLLADISPEAIVTDTGLYDF